MNSIGFKHLKKFPAFHSIRKLIAVFTTARHQPLFWARQNQSKASKPISLKDHVTTILLSSRSSKWFLFFRLFGQNPFCHMHYIPHSSQHFHFYYIKGNYFLSQKYLNSPSAAARCKPFKSFVFMGFVTSSFLLSTYVSSSCWTIFIH